MNDNIVNKYIKKIKTRFFIVYCLLLLLLVLIFVFGKKYISSDYFANIVTEIIGILLTVFIIDSIYNYFDNRDKKIHRDISLRYCKMPIRFYCYIWFTIYEPNQLIRKLRFQQFQNIEDFFMSDDFYDSVCSFNFAKCFSSGKTFAQFYADKQNTSEENFQNILAKYASKLSLEDIQRLEFFGGGAHLSKVFVSMELLNTYNISTQNDNTQATLVNVFKNISKENFQKHFKKLLALINDYNSVCNPVERWTLETLTWGIFEDANANEHDW